MSEILNHSPAEITRQVLIDLGIGSAPVSSGTKSVWPVHAKTEPDSPDDVITVYDTQGVDDGRMMVTGETNRHHGLNIRVRSGRPNDGWSKANSIVHTLGRNESGCLRKVTISGSSYLIYCYARISQPAYLGRETPASERTVHVINCIVALTMLN